MTLEIMWMHARLYTKLQRQQGDPYHFMRFFF